MLRDHFNLITECRKDDTKQPVASRTCDLQMIDRQLESSDPPSTNII